MRWLRFILLQSLLLAVIAGIFFIHNDRVIVLKKPPASLAKWYQPENKRQVWLHTMFKLRREMQAIRQYAEAGQPEHLQKWVDKFSGHYLEIGKMVPEWERKLDSDAISSLRQSAAASRFQGVTAALERLNQSCKSCHTDYRTVVASTYRAPNFETVKIDGTTDFEKHMEKLGEQINRIKIASEDGQKDVALSSLDGLNRGMQSLGKACASCHKKDDQGYPGETVRQTMQNLKQSLQSGTAKEQGRDLGTLAVLACARCHGTHRLAFDNRRMFSGNPDWKQLLKH